MRKHNNHKRSWSAWNACAIFTARHTTLSTVLACHGSGWGTAIFQILVAVWSFWHFAFLLSWVIDIKTWMYNLLRNGKYLDSSQLRISSDYLVQTLSSVLKPACVKLLLAPIFYLTISILPVQIGRRAKHRPKSLETLFFSSFYHFVFCVFCRSLGNWCPSLPGW